MPLDPELAAHLEAQRGLPPRSALTIEQTRERMRAMVSLAGEAPGVARVADALVGHVPVREYWPDDGDGLPCLVFFHGGRFFSGGLESHDPLCRFLATHSGCRVMAADYRLAPEHPFPAAVEDACEVLHFALGRAERVGVAGDSAGANLATVAAAQFRDGVRCQALLYPMIDATCSMASHRTYASGYGPGSPDMARGWREYMGGADPRDPRLSPLYTANLRGMPRTLVLTAEYDSLRDEGERYAARLREAGVSVDLRRYEGAIHGFLQLTGISELARSAVRESGGWIAQALLT